MIKPNKDKILGAIEVKSVMQPLKDSEQLQLHAKYFKYVIYTNGLEWRFYTSDGPKKPSNEELPIIVLGEKVGREILWYSEKWHLLLNTIKNIRWIGNE